MKKFLLFQAILCLFLFLSNSSLNAQWARQYNGESDDRAYSIQQTSDGGYIVAGSTGIFGSGSYGSWILKLDSNGEFDWQKTYGETTDHTRYIQQTSDGGYIAAGSTRSAEGGADAWIIKLSSSGDIEWQKSYDGGRGSSAESIQQTSDGGYIVAGDAYSSNRYLDFWVLKLDSTGSIDWQRKYGGIEHDSPSSIQQTTDGGYIVAGDTHSFGAGLYDFWVLKLGSNGDIEWQKTYGGSIFDHLYSIQQTNDGGYIVAGDTMSFGDLLYTDSWILKLSSNGDIDWQKTYGGGHNDWTKPIQQTSDGGYIVAGRTQSFNDLREYDGWVLKLSSNGDIDWEHTYDYTCLSIDQTSDGGYIGAGYTLYEIEHEPNNDIIILKLNSDGDIDSSCGFIGSSNASVLSTSVYPEDTFITPENTYVTPLDTDASPQDTNASVILLCEASQDDGGDEDGKGDGCFIATAAYGSTFHPYVEILREFRERYLMSKKLGRKFVDLYYKYSPFIADLTAKHKPLRVIVQINLIPFVVFSYSMVHLGPIITVALIIFICIFPIFLILCFTRNQIHRSQERR